MLGGVRRRGGGRRERIGIAGIGDDVADQSARLRVQHVGHHHRAAAIVEDAEAGAQHVRLRVARREGHRHARREVVVVVEVILPVVAQAERQRQAGARLPVVLDVGAQLLLQQRQVAVALLHRERIRPPEVVVGEAGEGKRAAEVGAIEEAAFAPVGQLKAGLDQVMSLRPRQALVQVHVRLGAHEIGLGAAAGERAVDDDRARRRGADGRLALVADEHLELVEQRRAEDRLLRVGDLLLVVRERAGRARQRRAADAAVLVELVLEFGRIEIVFLSLTCRVMLPFTRASPFRCGRLS